MRSFTGAVLLGVLTLASVAPMVASAAGVPTISITSPRNGAILHGASVSLTVSVSNFKLVPPVLHNAPVLHGNVGTIEYALDTAPRHATASNFSSAKMHRWTNLTLGRHELWAFLVTSKMVPLPHAKPAHVTIVVAPVARPRPAPKPPVHAGGPGVSSGPRTGGGAGIEDNPLNLSLLLAGIAALVIGMAALGRRFAFAGFSGFSFNREPSENPPAPDTSSAQPDHLTPPDTDVIANADTMATPASPADDPPIEPPTEISDDPLASLPTPMPADEAPAPTEEPVDQSRLTADELPPAPPPLAPNVASAPTEGSGPETPAGSIAPFGQSSDAGAAINRTPPSPRPMGTSARDQAVAMARQWASVVEGLVRQLDEQEAERRRMLERMNLLEGRLQAAETRRDEVWQQLRQRMDSSISGDDLSAVRYVTDSLLRDPDHIVVLAAVAQNAGKLHELVESYISMRQTLENI